MVVFGRLGRRAGGQLVVQGHAQVYLEAYESCGRYSPAGFLAVQLVEEGCFGLLLLLDLVPPHRRTWRLQSDEVLVNIIRPAPEKLPAHSIEIVEEAVWRKWYPGL